MLADLLSTILQSPLFQGSLVCVLLVLVYHSYSGPNLYPGFPTVGIDTSKGPVRGLDQARENWAIHGKEILDRGLKQVSSIFDRDLPTPRSDIVHWQIAGCFQVFTDTGPKIVLPNRFADEIRNHPDLHFGKAISKVCGRQAGSYAVPDRCYCIGIFWNISGLHPFLP